MYIGPMKVAHISDLHFSKFCFSPLQFFSKRWLGSANMLAQRSRTYVNVKPFSLPDRLRQEGVTHVLITGDIATTAQKSEFALGQELIDAFKERGMRVFTLPGNHDHYTKKAYKTRSFYSFFPSALSGEKVAKHHLEGPWHLVMIDTALATNLFQSSGLYTDEIDHNLRETLDTLPQDASVILANHFPFFRHEKKTRQMHGGEKLEKLIRDYPFIKLYIHGHTHRRCLADLRADNLAIILDSGSCSHRSRGSFNIVDLKERSCDVSVFTSSDRKGEDWKRIQKETFLF